MRHFWGGASITLGFGLFAASLVAQDLGEAFKQAQDGYSEAKVKEKIEAVVEHLESLQRP